MAMFYGKLICCRTKEELKLAKAGDGGSGGSQGGVCVACISRKDNHIV